jgi:hypothetical protein
MSDPFKTVNRSISGPALGSFAITPSDATNLVLPIRAITLFGDGALTWINSDGVTQTTAILPAGTYPLFATRIMATGTTATTLTGWV